MAQFTYKAKSGTDRIQTGTIEADNEIVAVRAIRRNGLYPISVKELTSVAKAKNIQKIGKNLEVSRKFYGVFSKY